MVPRNGYNTHLLRRLYRLAWITKPSHFRNRLLSCKSSGVGQDVGVTERGMIVGNRDNSHFAVLQAVLITHGDRLR